MLQIARLTDYSLVLLTQLAGREQDELVSCSTLAEETHIPLPTVRKILKQLNNEDLVDSKRGAHGGYHLARGPEEITIRQVITAMEGPVAITVCSEGPGECELEPMCGVSNNWQRINEAILGTLDGITVADMIGPLPESKLQEAQSQVQIQPSS